MTSRRTIAAVLALTCVAAEGDLRCDPTLSCNIDDTPLVVEDGGIDEEPCATREDCRVEELALGQSHTCARLDSGQVLCWGDGSQGQVGDGENSMGTTLRRHAPAQVVGMRDAIAIATGAFHSCAVRRSGAVYCWGLNADLQTGGDDERHVIPQRVPLEAPSSGVAAGANVSCSLVPGSVLCWGASVGPPTVYRDGPIEELRIGGAIRCMRIAGGELLCAGLPGDAPPITRFVSMGIEGVVDFDAGSGHICAIIDDAALCAGANPSGQLGDGSTEPRAGPIEVDIPGVPVRIAAGGVVASMIVSGSFQNIYLGHSCVATRDGELHCWGRNLEGQIGDGTFEDRSLPTRIALDGAVVDVELGGRHSCALLAGGRVRCWGDGAFGQLGDGKEGSEAIRALPEPVFGLP